MKEAEEKQCIWPGINSISMKTEYILQILFNQEILGPHAMYGCWKYESLGKEKSNT